MLKLNLYPRREEHVTQTTDKLSQAPARTRLPCASCLPTMRVVTQTRRRNADASKQVIDNTPYISIQVFATCAFGLNPDFTGTCFACVCLRLLPAISLTGSYLVTTVTA